MAVTVQKLHINITHQLIPFKICDIYKAMSRIVM